ncbi:MAG: glycosyltransferase family 1 protein [Eubacteriales bacterium]|nr:glycosyltransferase family 1 protein [Eubacteriales bacterium]
MIRILHIFSSMGNGGVEHYVMERYRLIDRSCFQFDFLVTSEEKGYFEEEIIRLGGSVYHTTDFSRNPIKAFFQELDIVKQNKYAIVHRHTGNAVGYIDLIAAKLGGAKHLILHSHNNSAERLLIHYFTKTFFAIPCTRFACSDAAGKWLFGRKSFRVMKNAIDVSKFDFDPQKREEFRSRYELSDSFVVGHVGRFDYQKNHDYLIEIFAALKKEKTNAKLVCVGDGRLMPIIQEKIDSLGLRDDVIFTGIIDNVNEIINVFDVFCLPSKYEGFGIVLIEAQANGLCCIASDAVSRESNLSGNVSYLPTNGNLQDWVDHICHAPDSRDENASLRIRKAGFDLIDSVKELQEFYSSLLS